MTRTSIAVRPDEQRQHTQEPQLLTSSSCGGDGDQHPPLICAAPGDFPDGRDQAAKRAKTIRVSFLISRKESIR